MPNPNIIQNPSEQEILRCITLDERYKWKIRDNDSYVYISFSYQQLSEAYLSNNDELKAYAEEYKQSNLDINKINAYKELIQREWGQRAGYPLKFLDSNATADDILNKNVVFVLNAEKPSLNGGATFRPASQNGIPYSIISLTHPANSPITPYDNYAVLHEMGHALIFMKHFKPQDNSDVGPYCNIPCHSSVMAYPSDCSSADTVQLLKDYRARNGISELSEEEIKHYTNNKLLLATQLMRQELSEYDIKACQDYLLTWNKEAEEKNTELNKILKEFKEIADQLIEFTNPLNQKIKSNADFLDSLKDLQDKLDQAIKRGTAFQNQHVEFKDQLTLLIEKINQLEKQLKETAGKIIERNKILNEFKEIQDQFEEFKKLFNQETKLNTDLIDQLDKLENKLNQAIKRGTAFQNQHVEFKDQLILVIEENIKFQNQLKQIAKQLKETTEKNIKRNKILNEFKEIQDQFKELLPSFNQEIKPNTEFLDQLNKLQDKLDRAIKRGAAFQNQYVEFKDQLMPVIEQNIEFQHQIKQLTKKYKEMQDRFNQKIKQPQEMRDQLEQTERQYNEMQDRFNQKVKQRQEMRDQLEQTERQYTEMQDQLEQAKKQYKEMQDQQKADSRWFSNIRDYVNNKVDHVLQYTADYLQDVIDSCPSYFAPDDVTSVRNRDKFTPARTELLTSSDDCSIANHHAALFTLPAANTTVAPVSSLMLPRV